MGPTPLPGLQARYSFVPAGDSVGLRLMVEFDPSGAGPAEAVHKACEALLKHLTGPPAATVKLSTTLRAEPFTAVESGAALTAEIAAFVEAIVAAPAPCGLELDFRIDPGDAAALPFDLFELAVLLDLGEGALVVAAPMFAEDRGGDELAALTDFAAAFEAAWDGFDGAGGALKLAAMPGVRPPALLCVRLSAAEGLHIARAFAAPAHHAVPPLSTSLLGGTVADLPDGGRETYSGVDLDQWWSRFARQLEWIGRALLGDNRAGSSERAEALAAVRSALAQAFAGRAAPLAPGTPDEGRDEVLLVLEEALQADLASRPTAAGVAVAVLRPAAGSRAFTATLRGEAAAPSGPAALRLKPGERRLAFAVSLPPEGPARRTVALRFEGKRLDRPGSPPLLLLRPEESAASGSNPLHVDLGELWLPALRIGVPSPPALVAQARAKSDSAATIGEALEWAVEASFADRPAAQDRLDLTLAFDAADAAVPADLAADGDLFEALARAVREAPEEPLDWPALDRFIALAAAVAEALPDWRAPARSAAALPAGRRYALDFGEAPALIVGREADGSGALPPWPVLAGYAAPESGGAVGRYEPEAGAEPPSSLTVTFTGLRAPAVRAARVHARIRRNGGLLAPAAIDPAFVYHGAPASSGTVAPRLDWSEPAPLPLTASLGAALDRLLDPIGEDPAGPYGLDLDLELVRRPAGADSEGVETRQPILAVRTSIGAEDGSNSLAALKAGLAAQLAEFRKILGESTDPAAIEFTAALWDRRGDPDPLARLRGRIPALADPAWWGQEPSKNS